MNIATIFLKSAIYKRVLQLMSTSMVFAMLSAIA